MPSIHVVRWIENIPDDYEVHWFDVLDRGALDTSEKVIQHLNWKQRSFHKFKGAFTLRKYFPFLYRIGVACYDTSLTKSFLKLVEEVKPDIVHSFNLQAGGFPILLRGGHCSTNDINLIDLLEWLVRCHSERPTGAKNPPNGTS